MPDEDHFFTLYYLQREKPIYTSGVRTRTRRTPRLPEQHPSVSSLPTILPSSTVNSQRKVIVQTMSIITRPEHVRTRILRRAHGGV